MKNPRTPLQVVDGDYDRESKRRPTEQYREDIDWCLLHTDLMNDWEADFCYQLLGFVEISVLQQKKLNAIIRKVEAGIRLRRRR